tara:strand:- start:286 stop:1341 length:1056 start_codon:yes stop_codon:yes gene_type:complete
MSWLSKWIDKRTGANRAIDVDAQQARYKNAMSDVSQGYEKMEGIAEAQMDFNSEANRNMLAMMESGAADNAAEASRLAMRTAAAGGGAPAAVMAAQTADTANRATANVQNQFMQGMQNQTENALQTLGGVYANQGQIAQAGFNMGESARSFNKELEQQVAQRKAGMLGGALQVAGGLAMGNPMMAMGGAGQMLAQKGGLVQKYQTGGPANKEEFKPHKMYDEDGKAHMASTYEAHLAMKKKGYDHYGPKGESKGYQGGGLLGVAQDSFKPVGNGESDNDTMLTMAMQKGGNPFKDPRPGDIIDAKLEPGEYVLNRNAVKAVGKENLDKLNNEDVPRFDDNIKMRIGGYLYG